MPSKQPSKVFTCPQCGKDFTDFHSNPNRKYCSNSCRSKASADPSKKTIFTCDWCHKTFETWTYRQPRFCSRQCMSEFGAHQPKPRTPRPENFTQLICEWCSSTYTVHKNLLLTRISRFCSNDCRHAEKSVAMRGNDNPNYIGGRQHPNRGQNWLSQRRKAFKRDNGKCQICKKDMGRIDVHHIIPYRQFNGDWKTANQPSNLITLCRAHHSLVELHGFPCPQPVIMVVGVVAQE